MVPEPLERSVYVLGSEHRVDRHVPRSGGRSTAIVWNVSLTASHDMLLWLLFGIGWLMVLLSTFLINHFELFGLQQAWFHMRGREASQAPELRQPFFYRWVAHPLYLGFFIAFWATPQMTVGHLCSRSACRSTS